MLKSCMVDWKKEYLAQDDKYFNHVSKFIDYLLLPTVQKDNQPANILEEDIDKCVGYYVNQGQILSEGSMESHLESIKAFYNFLIQKKYVKECPIISAHYSEFKANLVEKYNLKEHQERTWVGNDDIKMILERLDNYLDNSEYFQLNDIQKKQYIGRLGLQIYIKLSLIAPAKKATLLSLSFSNFDDNFRSLFVNNVHIRIPNGLHKNIIFAIQFLNKQFVKTYCNETKFFEFIADVGGTNDEKGTKLNRIFCSFLKESHFLDVPEESMSYSVEIINNTAIKNMVQQGTHPAYISQITGVTIGSLESKYYKDKSLISYNVTISNQINYDVAKSEYYNYI